MTPLSERSGVRCRNCGHTRGEHTHVRGSGMLAPIPCGASGCPCRNYTPAKAA